MSKALIIDDEQQMRRLLRMLLESRDYEVCEADEGHRGLQEAAFHRPDVVLLDLGLPGLGGLEVLKRLREWSDVPVLILSVRDQEATKVQALEIGADDYVTKPFNDRELMARVRVHLRRRGGEADPERLAVANLEVLPAEGVARRDGEVLTLTRTEFQLLCHLMRYPNRVWSRDQLLQHVWGYEYSGDGRLVDTHVARLRAKIETEPSEPTLLVTVRGLGYKLIRDAA